MEQLVTPKSFTSLEKINEIFTDAAPVIVRQNFDWSVSHVKSN